MLDFGEGWWWEVRLAIKVKDNEAFREMRLEEEPNLVLLNLLDSIRVRSSALIWA